MVSPPGIRATATRTALVPAGMTSWAAASAKALSEALDSDPRSAEALQNFGDCDSMPLLRPPDQLAFSATKMCSRTNRQGITVTRSFSFLDASGAVQQSFNRTTTNTVNVTTSTSGTRLHHDGQDTSTVNAASDFTVAGLASGSTQRTVAGKSAGTESTKGIKDSVAFTALRTAGDTITGLVIPIQDSRPTFPTAGTIIRSMTAVVTLAGQTPSTSSRREVITYDGSATAQVVITHDGVTKNCTKPLPHGGSPVSSSKYGFVGAPSANPVVHPQSGNHSHGAGLGVVFLSRLRR